MSQGHHTPSWLIGISVKAWRPSHVARTFKSYPAVSRSNSTLTGRDLFARSCLVRKAINFRFTPARCYGIPEDKKRVNLWDEYKLAKELIYKKPLPPDSDPKAVYANNELNLSDIDIYGFDYDYTIAVYTGALNQLIYDLGLERLVNDFKYPRDISLYAYHPKFAIRGLHCDIQRGYLMKIDAFHNVQLGSVYRGLSPVSDVEVLKTYHGCHLTTQGGDGDRTGPMLHQLMDIFALPEMTLYANIIEFFIHNDIAYDPEYVFYDVKSAIGSLHASQVLHQAIMANIDRYLCQLPDVSNLLRRLMEANKKVFLVTNSGFTFVNAGMQYLVGPDWMTYFDVIITNARKPKFFSDSNRQFRMYDPKMGVKSWNKVDRLLKGSIYIEGNYYQMIQLTGWLGSQVLYMGDHVYNDLADAIKLGWRTGAIIPELEEELMIMNTDDFKKSIRWMLALQTLISKKQVYQDAESQQTVATWLEERQELRLLTKNLINPRFGSLFRTYHNPTYFMRRTSRFADVYTSSIVNLLNYPLNHTFYPQRSALAHEIAIEIGDIV